MHGRACMRGHEDVREGKGDSDGEEEGSILLESHSLLSWGLSFSAVPMPTRIASCSVRILLFGGTSTSEPGIARAGIFADTRSGRGHAPVCHDHALLPAQDEVLPSCARDFCIEGLRECERHEWAVCR